ncbi:MAG: hypothetical protein JWO80_896 [Bryobacterales bacterium]|nr:hypothetical protein [Bryobacterales bacterium]
MTFPELIRFLIFATTRYFQPLPVAIEWVITGLAACVVAIAPFGTARPFLAIRNTFRAIARRKRLSIVICGTLPIALRLALLPWLPVPDPSIHDEFSHLLLADTFAHGRLTNPTHPMWEHFESIHVIQRPTYSSMYPPAQGAFLAVGQVLFHEPWAGVLVASGFMFAAMCWMMQGWLPPSWALFGTIVAILKFGIFGFWMNSYMGGSVPALGGALLIGAAPRLRGPHPRWFHACLLATGMVILMNSRPFDGAVLSAAALVWILPRLPRLKFALAPAAAVLLCGALFTGYYNWRVTGKPTRLAYQVNRDAYGWPENLGFLPAKELTLRHKVLQDMYLREIQHRDIYKRWDSLVENLDIRFFDNWTFFIGPLLTVPLVLLPWIFRDRRTRPLVIFLGLIVGLNLLQMVLYPYHLGPVVPVIFAIVAQGLRHIYVGLKRFAPGRAIYFALVVPFCLILIGAMKQQAETLGIPLAYWERGYEPHRDARAALEDWLAARPRKQLVIVRYAPDHSPDQEWVYNHADIDGSKVIWAREMDPKSDARLVACFPDREAWLLEADVYPPRVVPYRRDARSDDKDELK